MERTAGGGSAARAGGLRPFAGDAGDLQRQARALGDPTRYRIFEAVATSPEPVSVAALSRSFALHQNAVRQHLGKLCEAGLLLEAPVVRSGPGRPALRYRTAPAAAAAWLGRGPYEELAVLLLEILRSGDEAREVGARAGLRLGVRMAAGDDPVDVLEAEMARRGFDPRRVERGRVVELILQRCPFESAARADPDTVCALHHGLAEGLAQTLEGALGVDGLVARDPARAGCRLKLRRLAPPA